MTAAVGAVPRVDARRRQATTDERVHVLLADPAALNAWELHVLSVLADLPAGAALAAGALRRAAGYRDTRDGAFREKVGRLARAGLLEEVAPGQVALTETGRRGLHTARTAYSWSLQRAWLTTRQSAVLAVLGELPAGTWLPRAQLRQRLGPGAGRARATVEQLAAAGYLRCHDQLVALTETGRTALVRMGGVTDADVVDVAGYPHRATRPRQGLDVGTLPLAFRAAAKAYVRAELDRGCRVEGVANKLRALRTFLRYLAMTKPDLADLHGLTVADVDGFLAQRARRADGTLATELAQRAQRDLAHSLRFLDHLRATHSPLVPPTFTVRTFQHRLAIVDGAAVLRVEHVHSTEPTGLTPEAHTAAELAKDRWVIAHLHGLRPNPAGRTRSLGFERVPAPFRTLVKDYVATLLLARGHAPAHCVSEVRRLSAFLVCYLARHPAASTLTALAAADVEAWAAQLAATPNACGRPRTELDRVDQLLAVQRLVRWLQRTDRPEAPSQVVARIFLPERLPRVARSLSQDRIKYLPASVLAQVDAAIERFDAPYLPVLVVLRASGWRISDVLSLRWDRCLDGSGDRWWLVGDIHKTRLLGHRVPITAEVAAAIQVQIHAVRQSFTEAENPQHFLFPSPTPRRLGQPIAPEVIDAALRRFAARCGIIGPDGQPFRLRSHAFRHTKAVELINNGMSMAYVQHWLAHLTPEMTVIYARISQDTLHQQWEQAMARGAVQIRAEGPQLIDPEDVIADNELELAYIRGHLDATRVETGYCFKPLKLDCPFVEIACFTCHNHVTTADFLPQFQRQERDLLEQIEVGQAAGRPHWVEKNQKKLRAVQAIIAALQQQAVHGLPKPQREYGPTERARLAAQANQAG